MFHKRSAYLALLSISIVILIGILLYALRGPSVPKTVDIPIVITFDDSYLSNYEIAWPALVERDMVGTIFVIGVSVGKTTYKDTDAPIFPHFSYE